MQATERTQTDIVRTLISVSIVRRSTQIHLRATPAVMVRLASDGNLAYCLREEQSHTARGLDLTDIHFAPRAGERVEVGITSGMSHKRSVIHRAHVIQLAVSVHHPP